MAEHDEEEDLDLITVGKRRDDNKAVWDRDPRHPSNYGGPEGEVFISDMRPYQVARTAGIQQKIGEQEIQELTDRRAQARLADYEAKNRPAEEARAALREQMAPNAVTIVPPTTVTPTGNGGTPVAPVVSAPSVTTPASTQEGNSGVTDPDAAAAHADADGDDADDGAQTGSPTIARPRGRRPAGETPPER